MSRGTDVAAAEIFLGPFDKVFGNGRPNQVIILEIQAGVHASVELQCSRQLVRLTDLGIVTLAMIAIHAHHFVDIPDLAVLRVEDMQRPIGNREKRLVPGWKLAEQSFAKHRGAGRDVIAHPKIFQGRDLRVVRRGPRTGLLTAALVNNYRIMKTNSAFGVMLQKIDLLLQFVRRGPIIIAIQQRDIITPRYINATGNDRITGDIVFRQDQTSFGGKPLMITPHDFPCAIARTILADNNLVWKICLLHQSAVQSLRNERGMVIGHHQNAEFHDRKLKNEAASSRMSNIDSSIATKLVRQAFAYPGSFDDRETARGPFFHVGFTDGDVIVLHGPLRSG